MNQGREVEEDIDYLAIRTEELDMWLEQLEERVNRLEQQVRGLTRIILCHMIRRLEERVERLERLHGIKREETRDGCTTSVFVPEFTID